MLSLARPTLDAPRLAARPLRGRRVLLAEDEALIAMDLEMTLSDAGADIVGPCLRLDRALVAAWSMGLDAAVLDLTLGGRPSGALVDILAARGVPVVIHSGHTDPSTLLDRLPRSAYCPKPCRPDAIVEGVARLIDG